MHPRSEMGEPEADADASSLTGSVFSDGLHHTGSASRHYHYFVVSPSPHASDCMSHSSSGACNVCNKCYAAGI